MLCIGGLTQYKYAWCEPFIDRNHKYRTSDAPTCPNCGEAIALRRWLPPYFVHLKQPRNIGDFLYGVFNFAVTEKFKTSYDNSRLTGILNFYPLDVARMGTTNKEKSYPRPTLYGVEVVHSRARIDYQRSITKWWKPPQSDFCRHCGPGGGGKGGTPERIEGLFFEAGTWGGEDFFQPINLHNRIIVSELGAAFISENRFSNIRLIPAEHYGEDTLQPTVALIN